MFTFRKNHMKVIFYDSTIDKLSSIEFGYKTLSIHYQLWNSRMRYLCTKNRVMVLQQTKAPSMQRAIKGITEFDLWPGHPAVYYLQRFSDFTAKFVKLVIILIYVYEWSCLIYICSVSSISNKNENWRLFSNHCTSKTRQEKDN